jgi:hypothetical protein
LSLPSSGSVFFPSPDIPANNCQSFISR